MKILAFDSSGLVASVAIVENNNLIAEYTTNYKKTHSQTLLPMLEEIVKMTETDKESFDALAVAAGPGSFTGLRIAQRRSRDLHLHGIYRLLRCRHLRGLHTMCGELTDLSALSWTREENRCIRDFTVLTVMTGLRR